MKILQAMSDRLLSAFVPQASAAAHCVFCRPECQNGVAKMCCLNQCEDGIWHCDPTGGTCTGQG